VPVGPPVADGISRSIIMTANVPLSLCAVPIVGVVCVARNSLDGGSKNLGRNAYRSWGR